jgi:type I site-specific restriction-modification system R (restriction) subunit
MNPYGGTEIQLEYLHKYVSKELLDKVNITTSIPEKTPLLIDKTNIHNNQLQVLNQYEVEDGKRANRYDVTVLVNGLPLVHIELKKRGIDIKEAFNQINR